MLDNKLESNNREYYKFATVTVRVFVDKDDVDEITMNGNTVEAFDILAKEKIAALFPTEHPIKHYETDLA